MIRSFNGKTPKIAESAFVSEAAYVVGDVEIGENSFVLPGAVIRGDLGKITIGRNTIIEDNCVIHSGTPTTPPTFILDVTIGDNVVLGHGAASHARKIGNNVLVGMRSAILHDVEIGDYSVIAAGCVVKERMKVPEKSFVVGVPGEIKGEVSPRQTLWVREGPKLYHKLAQQYQRDGL